MRIGDAFGRAILDWLDGSMEPDLIERDDGHIETGAGPQVYLAPFPRWPSVERRAMRWARGRVLDVGCGGGRVALHLEDRGHEVVAIDVSPLALRACRRRGVRRVRRMALEEVDRRLGRFDTIVLFGNNTGLLSGRAKGRRILRQLLTVTTPGSRILAESMDPYATTDPAHLAYHAGNRGRGRLGGQLRLRVRYGDLATPWMDYLFVSPDELRALVDGSGWSVTRVVETEADAPLFVAVLERDDRPRRSRIS
jgi:SAM-dependent methyltransferase